MLNEYSEEGTDALSYGDQEIQNGLLSLGFGFNNLIKFDDSKLKPIGLVELGLDFSDSSTTKLNYVSEIDNNDRKILNGRLVLLANFYSTRFSNPKDLK